MSLRMTVEFLGLRGVTMCERRDKLFCEDKAKHAHLSLFTTFREGGGAYDGRTNSFMVSDKLFQRYDFHIIDKMHGWRYIV